MSSRPLSFIHIASKMQRNIKQYIHLKNHIILALPSIDIPNVEVEEGDNEEGDGEVRSHQFGERQRGRSMKGNQKRGKRQMFKAEVFPCIIRCIYSIYTSKRVCLKNKFA